MGPYSAFDARYAVSDPDARYLDDPLFDPTRHPQQRGRHTYEAALSELCDDIRAALGVRAFLATDIVTIPSVKEATSEAGMSVLNQSIAFAGVSDAVMFVFTEGGRTTGTGSEVGSILSEFQLRRDTEAPACKPRRRLSLFVHNQFSSASIDAIPHTFGVSTRRFGTKAELHSRIRGFVENIRREALDGPLPVYQAY